VLAAAWVLAELADFTSPPALPPSASHPSLNQPQPTSYQPHTNLKPTSNQPQINHPKHLFSVCSEDAPNKDALDEEKARRRTTLQRNLSSAEDMFRR
jgi:hypothetical protein